MLAAERSAQTSGRPRRRTFRTCDCPGSLCVRGWAAPRIVALCAATTNGRKPQCQRRSLAAPCCKPGSPPPRPPPCRAAPRAGQADPHRRADRHGRRLCGQHRPRIGARSAAWRSTTSRKLHPDVKVELVSADLQLKPDVALGIAGDWLRQPGRRSDHRRAAVLGGVRHRRHGEAEGQGGDLHRRRLGRHHRHALRTEPSALGLRHMVDAARRGGRDGEGGRRHLVLHHRRLRVRPFAGKGRGELRHRRRRQGARPGAGAVPGHHRFLRRSWCRRRPAAPR